MASLEQVEALVRRRMAECDPDVLAGCSASEVLRRSDVLAEALRDYWTVCREVALLERVGNIEAAAKA